MRFRVHLFLCVDLFCLISVSVSEGSFLLTKILWSATKINDYALEGGLKLLSPLVNEHFLRELLSVLSLFQVNYSLLIIFTHRPAQLPWF